MRHLLIIIFSLILLQLDAQQVYFNKTYSLNYAVTNATGIVQNGDYYYAIGVGFVNSGIHQKAVIYKINIMGQLIDTLIYSSLNDRYYTASPRNININNDYIFVTFNMVKNDTMQNDTVRSILMKLDTNLQIVWERYFNDTLHILNDPYIHFAINNMSATSDGGQISVVNINGIGTYHRLALMKTDSLGDTEWVKYPASDRSSYAIKQTLDSGFVYVSQGANGTVLYKLNKLGDTQWSTTILPLTPPLYQWAAHDLSITPEGDIVAGLNEIYDNDVYKKKIHLWKVNGTNGQIIWNKEYFFRYTVDNIYIAQHQAMGLDVLPDGSIIWSGHTLDYGGYGGIMKFNSSGDSLWSRMIDHAGLDSNNFFWGIWDLAPTSDNGFIICGSQKDYATGTGVTAWVVKLDSMGCDTPGCETVSIERALMNLTQLGVYPNPASETISITIPNTLTFHTNRIIIYNTLASKVKEIEITKNSELVKLNIEDLSPGTYYIQLLSDGKYKGRGSFIKN